MSARRPFLAAFVSAMLALAVLGVTLSGAGAATKKAPRLEILVSNDDGVTAEGIAVLTDELRKLPRVNVTVSAPATNQTGAGGKTTVGTVSASPAFTSTGYAATAVQGYPADSVNYAIDNVLKKTPNVIVSGVNIGQNLGTITDASGTVGAARAAAQRGIPALAVSANLRTPDYATAAKLAAEWVQDHRAELGKKPKTPVLLESLNVPTCPGGAIRGIAKTTVATTSENALLDANSASTVPHRATTSAPTTTASPRSASRPLRRRHRSAGRQHCGQIGVRTSRSRLPLVDDAMTLRPSAMATGTRRLGGART